MFHGELWFSSVTTVDNIVDVGKYFKGTTETAHTISPKEFRRPPQRTIWMVITYLEMESYRDGKNMSAVGYNYFSKKCYFFGLKGVNQLFLASIMNL